MADKGNDTEMTGGRKKQDGVLSIARIYYPVTVLGPGRRVGIWVTGCPRRCKGCISPELQRYDSEREMTVEEILSVLGQIPGGVDGFTVSGGEPFLRPEALGELLEGLARVNDDILVFTGYTYEELLERADAGVTKALSCCAALVDGPYVEERNDGVGLRGSANQRCLVFRYAKRYAGAERQIRQVQNVILGDRMLMIGIPGGTIRE